MKSTRFLSVISLGLILAMLLSAFPTSRVYADTWIVTSSGDFWGTCPHATDCTLRTAISWSGG